MSAPLLTENRAIENFESALQELELLVKTLEEGQMPLEQMTQAYARGLQLKQYCEAKLQEATVKIETIQNEGLEKQEKDAF